MKKQSRNSRVSGYADNAAVYQPDQGQLVRTISLVLLLVIVLLIGIATKARAEQDSAGAGSMRAPISASYCQGIR